MKVDQIPGLQSQLARGASSISFAGGGDFASKLTLGQIIKGRVLRSYEGNRHLVDFGGQQKVVDSAIPLRADEIVYGRVIGLSERVELQRVNASVAAPDAPASAVAAGVTGLSGKSGELISGLFDRFHAQIAPSDVSVLQRAVERASQPDRMALAGLVLAKLGIPLSMTALRAVFEALRADPRAGMFSLPERAIHLATQPLGAEAVSPVAAAAQAVPASAALSALLREVLEGVPELQRESGSRNPVAAPARGRAQGAAPSDGQRARDPRDRRATTDVARLILNVQAGGAVAHRTGTLPLFVDGSLVELNVALFEQSGEGSGDAPEALKHRQVVLAVTTESLGRVEVRAAIAGTHMRVNLSTESSASAQYLARHAGRLAADLESSGWQVDELVYETVPQAAPGAVARTVLEHLVSPGSVSALA